MRKTFQTEVGEALMSSSMPLSLKVQVAMSIYRPYLSTCRPCADFTDAQLAAWLSTKVVTLKSNYYECGAVIASCASLRLYFVISGRVEVRVVEGGDAGAAASESVYIVEEGECFGGKQCVFAKALSAFCDLEFLDGADDAALSFSYPRSSSSSSSSAAEGETAAAVAAPAATTTTTSAGRIGRILGGDIPGVAGGDCIKSYRDIFLFVAAFYYFVITPFQVAFFPNDPRHIREDFWFTFSLCYFFDICLIIDALVLRNPVTRVSHIALVPVDIIGLIWFRSAWHLALCRLPKLLLCYRLWQGFSEFPTICQTFGLRYNLLWFEFIRVVILFMLTWHVIGCGWFIFARFLGGGWSIDDAVRNLHYTGVAWEDIPRAGYNPDATMAGNYLRAVHFAATTLSSAGTGDIRPITNQETIYEMFVVIVKAIWFAARLGVFAGLMSLGDSYGKHLLKGKYWEWRGFLSSAQYSFPQKYRNLLKHSFKGKSWRRQRFDDVAAAVGVPATLGNDIIHLTHLDIFQLRACVLSRFPIDLQKKMAPRLDKCYVIRNEVVFLQDTFNGYVYFVQSGSVVLENRTSSSSSSSSNANVVEAGGMFADIDDDGDADNWKTYTARAQSSSLVYFMLRSDWAEYKRLLP